MAAILSQPQWVKWSPVFAMWQVDLFLHGAWASAVTMLLHVCIGWYQDTVSINDKDLVLPV